MLVKLNSNEPSSVFDEVVRDGAAACEVVQELGQLAFTADCTGVPCAVAVVVPAVSRV